MCTSATGYSFGSFIRLHKPPTQSYKIPGQEAPFDEIMQGFEEQRSTFVGQTRLPVPRPSNLLTLEKFWSEEVGEVGVISVPEDPKFLGRSPEVMPYTLMGW